MNKIKWANNSIPDPDQFDGINYPSVAFKYRGDNVALIAESAKRKLKLVAAYHIEYSEINVEKCDFKVKHLYYADKFDNGVIRWEGIYIGHEHRPFDNPDYFMPTLD
jgi:hypothetical protein